MPTLTAAFRRGLGETGFVEGQNVEIKYRWAHGQFDQLPALAADLVAQQVSVIAALGTPASATAAKAATSTIPIIFVTGVDPVDLGLVKSLNRPAGNATGVYMLTVALEPKRLELIHELVPDAADIGIIADPNSPDTVEQMKSLSTAASSLGRRLKTMNVSGESDIEPAFAAMAEQRVAAAVVTSSPAYLPQRQKFVALAARYAIPTAYFVRDFADAGGLISYGTNFPDAYRRAGVYTGRFSRAICLPTCRSSSRSRSSWSSISRPPKRLASPSRSSLLGRADEVIDSAIDFAVHNGRRIAQHRREMSRPLQRSQQTGRRRGTPSRRE